MHCVRPDRHEFWNNICSCFGYRSVGSQQARLALVPQIYCYSIVILQVIILFEPESARFEEFKGKLMAGGQVLRRVAKFNFTSLPPGELLIPSKTEDEGNGKYDVRIEVKERDPNECGNDSSSTFKKSFPANRVRDIESSCKRKPLILLSKIQIKKNNSYSHNMFFQKLPDYYYCFLMGCGKSHCLCASFGLELIGSTLVVSC